MIRKRKSSKSGNVQQFWIPQYGGEKGGIHGFKSKTSYVLKYEKVNWNVAESQIIWLSVIEDHDCDDSRKSSLVRYLHILMCSPYFYTTAQFQS